MLRDPPTIPAEAVGLRLCRITQKEELILCEPVRFTEGRAGVETTLRRAKLSGVVSRPEVQLGNHHVEH